MKKKFLKKSLQLPIWSHLTLFVLYLNKKEEIENANNVLIKSKSIIDKYYSISNPIIHFNKLNSFGERVLFIDCDNNDELYIIYLE